MLTTWLDYRSCAVLQYTIGIDKREVPSGQSHNSFHLGGAFCTRGYRVWSSGERETVMAATWNEAFEDQTRQLDRDKVCSCTGKAYVCHVPCGRRLRPVSIWIPCKHIWNDGSCALFFTCHARLIHIWHLQLTLPSNLNDHPERAQVKFGATYVPTIILQ
jgi:hypothetical protein